MLCSLLKSQFNLFNQQTRLDVALWCRIPLKHERWLLCILVWHIPATIELKWTKRDIQHSTSDKGRPQWTNRWPNRCCSYKSILRSFYSYTLLICVSKLIYLHRCWLRQEARIKSGTHTERLKMYFLCLPGDVLWRVKEITFTQSCILSQKRITVPLRCLH